MYRSLMIIDQDRKKCFFLCSNPNCEAASDDTLIPKFYSEKHAQDEGWTRVESEDEDFWLCPSCSK